MSVVEPVQRPKRRADKRGRPWKDTRAVLHGVLWVLGTGAQWRNCQKGTRLSRPAPADSSSGCGAGYWKRRSGDWRGACMSADSRTWTRRSWMPPSRAPKGGLRRRPHCAKDSEVQNGRSSFFILGLSREDCSCKQLERSGVAQGKPSRHNLFERARFDIFGPSTDAVSARGHPCSCGG